MDFGSINRRHKCTRASTEHNARARRSFSTSNLSHTSSTTSTSVGRRSLCISLPKAFGCELTSEGRVLRMKRGGPAHASGVIQVGDYVRVFQPGEEDSDDTDTEINDLVNLHVTYGVLEVECRPSCPLVIKIGNRSNTSLGIALADTADKQIKITSVQKGSLADRCGFIAPGDLLTSVQISSNETIPCSPYYTSYQVAQILRKLATTKSSVTMTIVPTDDNVESSENSGSTLTLRETCLSSISSKKKRETYSIFSKKKKSKEIDNDRDVHEGDDDGGAGNECILSLCLWKDRLYEDWGFSLIDGEADHDDGVHDHEGAGKTGAYVHQIRPGGPAFVAGLRPHDRILQINDRDVKHFESTILVPILASLDDALNLVISRDARNSDRI